MTSPKTRFPINDHYGLLSCPKHKLCRAFVDGLIDNDEKVASSKKHTQFKTRVQNLYLIYDQTSRTRFSIYDPKV